MVAFIFDGKILYNLKCFAVHFSQFTFRSSLFAVHFSQFTFRSSLFAVHFSQFTFFSPFLEKLITILPVDIRYKYESN